MVLRRIHQDFSHQALMRSSSHDNCARVQPSIFIHNLDDKELFMRTVKGVSWVPKRQMNMSKVQVVCGYVTSTTLHFSDLNSRILD